MIKKRDVELICPNGDIYPYSKTYLAYFTVDKKYARLRRFKKVQDGDDETTQIAEWKDLVFIANYLGNKNKKEIAEYQSLVSSKLSVGSL